MIEHDAHGVPLGFANGAAAEPFPAAVMDGEDTEENPFIAVNGVKTVTLYRPLTVNGRELRELTLDFNKLTAADLDNIEAEMAASGGMRSPVAATSNAYNLRVAARAAGVNHNELKRLNAKDAAKLSLMAQNFLLG